MKIRRLACISLLCLVGTAKAVPIPVATAFTNVADTGIASVYETSGGGIVTPVSNINDTETDFTMTITGEWLGIEIALQSASDLIELGAFVDPDGQGSDIFKSTDSVEFFTSTDNGATFFSAGFGIFDHAHPGPGSYVSLDGFFAGTTHVRYRFHQADNGAEGQRLYEAVAFVPEPGMLALMSIGLIGLSFAGRRRRA